MSTKLCPRCDKTKLLAEFGFLSFGRPQSWCRECRNADGRARNAAANLRAMLARRQNKNIPSINDVVVKRMNLNGGSLAMVDQRIAPSLTMVFDQLEKMGVRKHG